jgi:FixJ family two-component response regulator
MPPPIPHPGRASASSVPEPVVSQKHLVAVVDDDQSFRDSMRRLLKSLGYAVAAFPSASEFLRSPKMGDADCLVADIQMPVMSGVELCRHLKETGRWIPTILVTAYEDDSVEERIHTLGIECQLRKPLEEAELIDCLRSACERGKAPRKPQ